MAAKDILPIPSQAILVKICITKEKRKWIYPTFIVKADAVSILARHIDLTMLILRGNKDTHC